jgi:hypothetical protein
MASLDATLACAQNTRWETTMGPNARSGFGPQGRRGPDDSQCDLHGGRRIPAPVILALGGGLVSLGQLRLERLGDAADALEAFDDYPVNPSSGALVEEAFWGRIRALERLVRTPEEVEAMCEFLAAHPASLWADEARERLAKLEGTP